MNLDRVKQQSKALVFCQSHEILKILEGVINQMLEDEPADVPAYFVSKLDAFITPPVPTFVCARWCSISHLLTVKINVLFRNTNMALGEYSAKSHCYDEDHHQSLLLKINSFLETCKLEVGYQILLDRFLREQYKTIFTLQAGDKLDSSELIALPPKSNKNVKVKDDPVVPNAIVKPAPSSAILLTSISFAFNFALTESALPLSEGYNLRKHLMVLSKLLSEMRQQYDDENVIQMYIDSKSSLYGLPQLALIPEYQKNCKCIREILVFPRIPSNSYKVIFSRLYSEAFQPPVADKMEQMLDFAISFLRERNLENTFYLTLVCEPYAFYNEVKGKYEPTKGAFKSASEMVHVYANLLQAYPHIKILTNPFRTEDWHAWLKLQETIKNLDNCHFVEICASSDALDTGLVLRLSPSPSISEMAYLVNRTSNNLDESDRKHTFGISNIIGIDGTFGAQTSCCFLLDIAEAILWVKYRQKKKIQVRLTGNCASMRRNRFALAVAIAFGADYINFGDAGSTTAQVLLAEWINLVHTNTEK